jgi:hypothetical protein
VEIPFSHFWGKLGRQLLHNHLCGYYMGMEAAERQDDSASSDADGALNVQKVVSFIVLEVLCFSFGNKIECQSYHFLLFMRPNKRARDGPMF